MRRGTIITDTVRIAGASGFWGESAVNLPELLAAGSIDYVVFDYLAEITMSILARARAKDSDAGYATDFVDAVMAPNLATLAEQGVRVVSNAGGVNPQACAARLRQLIAEAGLDLSVAVVRGDDLVDRAECFATTGVTEQFTGQPFPPAGRIASINAYLGARPIAVALESGADIVITGRVVDSAVALGACIHAFDWQIDAYDRLAGGSLAGHVLECSTQATGGNHTDWETVADSLADIGYPVAEIAEDGSFVVSKPEGSGGAVTVGTVSEQLLYEIEDPQAYVLPDVVCDFSDVRVEQLGADRVRVAGARGRPPTETLKASVTWADGFRAGQLVFLYGDRAADRARAFAAAVRARTERLLAARDLEPMIEWCVETFGDDAHYGAFGEAPAAREVTLKIAARHGRPEGVGILLREVVGAALAAPPGLTLFSAAGRPRPSPVVRLFSFLVPRSEVRTSVHGDGDVLEVADTPSAAALPAPAPVRPAEPTLPDAEELVEVPLVRLAWARSGDKGDRANIGVIARAPELLPWLWAALTVDAVNARFAHFSPSRIERFLLPGPAAINFVLHDVLGGGGVASLRNDPQGKGYSQLLLAIPVRVPARLLEVL
ncbi:MAG: acyclic terpene utilization AtuA family protein [Pseudomonadota bacterium]